MALSALENRNPATLKIILCSALLVAALIAVGLFYAARFYVLSQAEDKIEDLLLAHKGIHYYVQQVMHPALYRYKDEGEMKEEFYAPELFSSSFIIRNQHVFYNEERLKAGYRELYYKLAANNPRNPVNMADAMEGDLVRRFNEDRSMTKYRKVQNIDGNRYLYVALPFLENQPQCMVCHGKREDAPEQLQERYPGEGGYNEKIGEIRAIISVRAPLEREYMTAAILALATGSGILVIGGLFFFNNRLRSLVRKRTRNLEEEIYERRQIEDKLREVNLELGAKNRELEQVVYVASHDLRSPLVNVQGFSQELALDFKDVSDILKDPGIPDPVRRSLEPIVEDSVPESIDFISRSIAKMDSLLSGLLKISRLGRASMTVVSLDMDTLVQEVAADFEFQTKEKRITLTREPLPGCMGDAMQISQVFSNLIGNAVKFSDPSRPGMITVTGCVDGDRAVYCVEDNGIGIDPDHHGKIFEIFHQLDPSGDGQGLGLNIVSRIVERHGGGIRVESEPGRYTRFFVTLPGSTKTVG